MKFVNGIFAVILLLFAAVQYNDPDAFFWIPAYLIPAFWAAAAAYRPNWLRGRLASMGLAACVGLAIAGVIYFWPQDAGWWHREVWWQSETAREGMGVMIVTASLLIVSLTWFLAGRQQPR